MTFYVQKNSFMYRLFLEIPQGAEKNGISIHLCEYFLLPKFCYTSLKF